MMICMNSLGSASYTSDVSRVEADVNGVKVRIFADQDGKSDSSSASNSEPKTVVFPD
jgi:hypothetical protein